MKYFMSVFFVLLAQSAIAGQCKVDGGGWQNVSSGLVTTVTVSVNAISGAGVVLLSGYTLTCRFTPSSSAPYYYVDYWHTDLGAIVPGPKFALHAMGLVVNGVYYGSVASGMYISSMGSSNEAGHDLKTYMYLKTTGAPGSYVDIRAGDVIGTLNLVQTNNYDTTSPRLKIEFRAGNDLFFEPSTCTINNNVQLDVDFMDVGPTTIGTNPISSAIKQDKTLLYSCPDPDIDATITMTFKGTTASFNSNLLATSNPDIGVALLRSGAEVRLESFFTTSIK